MKLSVFANLYKERKLDKVLSVMRKLGIDTLEMGAGGYSGKDHCDPALLLTDNNAFYKFRESFNKYGMDICALSVHGNPVHPVKEIAQGFDVDFKNAVLLSEKLEIDTVVTFSGCPGDHEGATYPNWVSCFWPDDYGKILDWQWNEVLLPYWYEASAFAREHGVTRIALEMCPGFCVYNPETLLRIRNEVGDVIGANLDPSHLIWQGIDPVAAIRSLKGATYHVHAKDVAIDKYNTAVNGVLDTKKYSKTADRSFIFRTVGYGQSESAWRDIFSALIMNGYDRSVSVEQEDSLISEDEGLKKAVEFLRPLIIE